ncbi:MAG: hypothetical protein ACLFP2_02760 [Candidatus Woesearchaeota archaeon]
MKHKGGNMNKLWILVILLCASLACGYEQGIHLVRPDSEYITQEYTVPEYLSVEDLTFLTCLEDEELSVSSSVMCLDNNNFEDVSVYQWGEENCYIGSFNLEQFDCDNVRIQSEYTKDNENYRLYKDLRLNTFSELLDIILNTQYTDGGWKTNRDTAYGILGLSQFPDLFDYEIGEAVEYLQMERNEEKKCWPDAPCDIPLTMEILYILTHSGIDDARRVVHDARNWIEYRQNYYEQGDKWSVEVTPLDNPLVFVASTGKGSENFSLEEDESQVYSFDVTLNTTLSVASYDPFDAKIMNQHGDVVYTYQGDNLSYSMPGAGWSLHRKGEPCDHLSTAYAANLDLHDPNKREAKRWMFSELKFADTVGFYFKELLPTALWVSAFSNTSSEWMSDYEPYMDRFTYIDGTKEHFERYREETLNWLLFQQNNEGSWGPSNGTVSEKAVPTAISVMALQAFGMNRTFEPIEDAEQWLSENEVNISRNDTTALGSSFYVLRNNARPILTSEPGVVVLDEEKVSFDLFNPTPFDLENLKYNFSESIRDVVRLDEKSTISSYSYRKLNLYKETSSVDEMYGFLNISTEGKMVARVPVIITDFPSINVTPESPVRVFGRSGAIPLEVDKSHHEFICSVDWEQQEISSSNFKIKSSNEKIDITFDMPDSKEALYTGVMECEARGKSYSQDISVYINRYSSYPLTLSPTNIYVNSSKSGFNISVKNNLDVQITPEIEVPDEFFQATGMVTLNPGETKSVNIANLVPSNMNYTTSFDITVSTLGESESLPVVVDIEYMPDDSSIIPLIIVLSFIIVVGGSLGYLVYYYRKPLMKYLNKMDRFKVKQEIEEKLNNLDDLKKEEKVNSVSNMVKILKFQDKKEEEIRETLKKYFTDDEIEEALRKGGLTLGGPQG